MKLIHISTFAAAVLVGCSNPEAEPNKLFTEASQLVKEADAIDDSNPGEAYNKRKAAVELIEKIPMQYPQSSLSVKISEGDVKLNGKPVGEIELDLMRFESAPKYFCFSCKKSYQNLIDPEDIDRGIFPAKFPGAIGDAVQYCAKCRKGPAHPVRECDKCSTFFVLYLMPKYDAFGDPSCPKCDAAYGQAAKDKGIDLMPIELNP